MNIAWKWLLLIIGISTLTLRFLLDSRFGTSTLVYILIPFLISLALAFFTKSSRRRRWGWRFLNHMRISTIVFLATSVLLFEGFICVLMFMPIYYLFVGAGFLVAYLARDKTLDDLPEYPIDDDVTDVFKVSAIPTLVMVLVMEGLFTVTTVPRPATATFVADSPLSVAELQANMAQPITFPSERNWFLQLFPMPDRIEAASLGEGHIHTLGFTYKR